MRIGIDITLLGAIYTGQHFYIISLLTELFKLAPKDEFYLFSYDKNGEKEFSHFKNVKFVPVINGKYKNIKRIYFEYVKIPKIIKKYHLNVFFSPAFILNIKDKSIKKIVTVHDLIYKKFPRTYKNIKNFYLNYIIKKSLKNAQKIIAISNNTKKDIMRYFHMSEDKIIVNYYGVDEIFFHPIPGEKLSLIKKKLALPDNYFVYVGTLEPRKNIPYILRNFDKFVYEYPYYKFLIYGWEGNLPAEVFKAINRMKNKNNVEFRGYINHKNLPYIYKLSKGLLFLSLYEGFGLPPVEAMASGCPVYVSKLSSIPEIVDKAGIYIDTQKEFDLYDKLKKYNFDKELLNKKIQMGKRISKNYTWKKAANETYKIIIEGEK